MHCKKYSLKQIAFILTIISLGTISCQLNQDREIKNEYFIERDLSFFDPYDTDYGRQIWIRKPENIRTAHETFKKIGYRRLLSKYDYATDWCWVLGDVNKPCNEIIDSLLISYSLDSIESKYYREFWNRRKFENNDQTVYEILKEVRAIVYGDSLIQPRAENVNDTLYRLIEIREFEDSLTVKKARENFEYLKVIGLHSSAYNLLYERYRYYGIDWNQEKLEKELKTDTIHCCPWAFIEDNTK